MVLSTPGHVDLLFDPPLRELDRLIAQARATTPGSRPALRSGIDYEAERRALIKRREAMPAIREMEDTIDFVRTRLPGSWGLLYERDDETTLPPGPNAFRVTVLARGELSVRSDPFLSPCIPVIED